MDTVAMSGRRVVMAITASVVAVLAGTLVGVRWDDANKIAVVASALAAVAAVGVGVWAGLPALSSANRRLRTSRTGRAVAGPGGRANSGLIGSVGSLPGDVLVDKTGDADGSKGGDANTGIQLD